MTTHVCQIEKLKNYKIRSVKCHRIGSVSFQLIYASFHLKVNRKAIQRYSTVSTVFNILLFKMRKTQIFLSELN